MKKINLRKLVAAALFAALACVATLVIQVPSPIGGYLNLGDCVVLLCGWLLEPIYGSIAAGLGPALADGISGYVVYAPATFVIKALMALAAYFIGKIFVRSRYIASLVSGVCAEAVMVLGYFAFEAMFLQLGWGASAGIVSNIVQGITGVICAFLLKEIIDRKKLWKY